jgi:hypothetical protein
MKYSILAIISSAACATAFTACGYTLVNNNGTHPNPPLLSFPNFQNPSRH